MPRFLHVKPKANPEPAKSFEHGILLSEYFLFYMMSCFYLVFESEYFADITMSLNRTRSIPNSTEVWWEMSEKRTNFRVTPSCKLKKISTSCTSVV